MPVLKVSQEGEEAGRRFETAKNTVRVSIRYSTLREEPEARWDKREEQVEDISPQITLEASLQLSLSQGILPHTKAKSHNSKWKEITKSRKESIAGTQRKGSHSPSLDILSGSTSYRLAYSEFKE
ncbi:hypothetical protein Tco_0204369 [Tanacetum coccineum]